MERLEPEFYTDDDLITQIIDDGPAVGKFVTTDWREPSVDIGVCSVVGAREEQQDAVISSSYKEYDKEKKMIAVLCDGMGGLNGGAMISRTCVDALYQAFHTKAETTSYRDFYRDEISQLDKKVAAMTDASGNLLRGGSTIVSVVVENGMLHWASVGDSRIYIFRKGKLGQITRDHNYLSLLMERVGRKQMTLEEAMTHPKREALISFLGMDGLRVLDTSVRPIQLIMGDYLILCSDGLYRALSDMEIVQALLENEFSMQGAVEQMIHCAQNKRLQHQDNTSVIAIRFQ